MKLPALLSAVLLFTARAFAQTPETKPTAATPAEQLKVGQRVQVTVMEVDMPRKRIALSLKTKVELGPRDDRKAEAGKRDVQRFTGSGGGAKPSAPSGPDWFTLAQQKR